MAEFCNLHADNAIDEEYENDEQCDPGQGLEWLEEGPEQSADALALAEQLHQPHHPEQPEERNGDHVAPGLQGNNRVNDDIGKRWWDKTSQ